MAPHSPSCELQIPLSEDYQRAGPIPGLPCPFCNAEAEGRNLDQGALTGGHGWFCACGAKAVPLALHDLDETFDDVLALFGIPSPDEPPRIPAPEPVGTSGMLFATWYDGPALLRELLTLAASAGFQVHQGTLRLRYLIPNREPTPWSERPLLWARR